MPNNQLQGWNETETIEFFTLNRNKYTDLYDSEKYFITNSFLSSVNTVLDVGCSVGGMYNIFSSLNKNINYTGLDVSSNAIDKAKEAYKKTLSEFYLYDGVASFPMDKKFDLVFCTGVMHLIDNYKFVFDQMLKHSNKYLLLDFRVTTGSSYKGKFYFTFSDKEQASNSTNYYVLNLNEILNFFKSFNEVSKVYIYGYKGKASEMSENIDEVYMVFFKIEISNTSDNMEVVFENEELKNEFKVNI